MRDADGAAERAAEVVHDDLGLGVLKGIAGVDGGVLQVLEDAAVVFAGTGFGDGSDVGYTRELGVVVGLADADLLDGVEGGEHLVDGAGVLDADAADAVDGDAEQCGRGTHNVEVAAVVGLNAGLGGEGIEMGLVEPVERE
jgi:hypothetical protein